MVAVSRGSREVDPTAAPTEEAATRNSSRTDVLETGADPGRTLRFTRPEMSLRSYTFSHSELPSHEALAFRVLIRNRLTKLDRGDRIGFNLDFAQTRSTREKAYGRMDIFMFMFILSPLFVRTFNRHF